MSYTKCNDCDQPSPKCGCAKPKPKMLDACTPGHFYRIDCEAYKATCVPKGFPFWVLPGEGCCEGLHIGSGDKGTAMDRVLMARDFSASKDFRLDGCSVNVDWNRICAAAQSARSVDGKSILICDDGDVSRISVSNFLETMCFQSVGDLGEQCGKVSQLVIVEENGCAKLATTSEATRQNFKGAFDAVAADRLGENQYGFILPDNFADPTLFYGRADYFSDGGVNTVPGDFNASFRPAPGIDESKIENSLLTWIKPFELKCHTVFDIKHPIINVGEPDGNAAYARSSSFGFRVRRDGGLWNYGFSRGPGTLSFPNLFRSTVTQRNYQGTLVLPAGRYEVQSFFIAPSAYDANNRTWSRLAANTARLGYSAQFPRISLTARY